MFTYETMLVMMNEETQETLITAISSFNKPELKDGISFLSYIKQNEKEAPKTGRFETITESMSPYSHKDATCVRQEASKKDYGVKRNEEYVMFETYGMYCIHPYNENIAFFIQLSRKAPLSHKNKSFKKWGQDLLDSVTFKPFKI